LGRLNSADEHAANLLPYFQLRLAMVLGFTPDIDRDLVKALPEEGGVLSLDDGAVLPLHAQRTGRRASRTALRAYAVFARADLDTIMRMRLEPAVRHEIHALIEAFMHYHTEDAYPARSDKVHGQLMQPIPPSSRRRT
jgi:DNA repair protein RecO (recombination protein O)